MRKIIMSDDELRIIEKLVKRIAARYKFGMYGIDDIEQEARRIGIEGLAGYHPEQGPLENFLHRHFHNRLRNLKRNKFKRVENPCEACHKCHSASLTTGPHTDKVSEKNKGYCERYLGWLKRNNAKQSLASPVNQVIDTPYEDDLDDKIDKDEIYEKIDRNIPVYLREFYLKMRVGDKISSNQRKLVLTFIQELLGQKED